jgi:hypothetical protein
MIIIAMVRTILRKKRKKKLSISIGNLKRTLGGKTSENSGNGDRMEYKRQRCHR